MTEEYVCRTEFNALKEEVNEIKQEMSESSKLLQTIDKKLDVIDAKMVSSDKIDDLKLAPLEKRISTLEENRKVIKNTFIGAVISLVVGAIVFVIKMM